MCVCVEKESEVRTENWPCLRWLDTILHPDNDEQQQQQRQKREQRRTAASNNNLENYLRVPVHDARARRHPLHPTGAEVSLVTSRVFVVKAA